MKHLVYVGLGNDRIARYRLDVETGEWSALGTSPAGRHPSFLAFAPSMRCVYVVNEFSNELAAFAIDPSSGELTLINRVSTLGVEPAFVSVDASGHWALAANYRSGPVVVYPIEASGALGAPSDSKTTGVHPHAILLDASNAFAFVPNAGSNTISQFRFDGRAGKLVANEPREVATGLGSGPRHLAFHPRRDVVYFMEENGCRIDVYALDRARGTLSPMGSLASLPAGAPPSTGADIHVSPSGKFLYASNRGHDSIVICAIGDDGGLTLVGHESTRGRTPRNFGIDPTGTFLFAANQESGTVATFRITDRGTLEHLRTTEVPAAPYWVGVVTLPEA
jgi:6-phosphogluconolactonase